MTTLFDSAAPVKSAPYLGTPPAVEDREPFMARDLQDVAEMFDDVDEENAWLEERALQAAWDAQFDVF